MTLEEAREVLREYFREFVREMDEEWDSRGLDREEYGYIGWLHDCRRFNSYMEKLPDSELKEMAIDQEILEGEEI